MMKNTRISDVSRSNGERQSGWFIMENPIKIDPPFQEISIYILFHVVSKTFRKRKYAIGTTPRADIPLPLAFFFRLGILDSFPYKSWEKPRFIQPGSDFISDTETQKHVW